MSDKDNAHIQLGRVVDAATDLCHLALNRSKDAERYRFIRSAASCELDGVWDTISNPECVDEKMDEAIDAAMRLQPQSGRDS